MSAFNDHDLETVDLVSRSQQEAARVGPDRLIDGERNLDVFGAVLAAALTDERCTRGRLAIRTELGDTFVDLAEQSLVPASPLLPEAHLTGQSAPRAGLGATDGGNPLSQHMSAQEHGNGESVRAQKRRANTRIANRADSLQFKTRVPFLCECGDPNCRAIVLAGIDEFNALVARFESLLAPGHETD